MGLLGALFCPVGLRICLALASRSGLGGSLEMGRSPPLCPSELFRLFQFLCLLRSQTSANF